MRPNACEVAYLRVHHLYEGNVLQISYAVNLNVIFLLIMPPISCQL